MDKRVLAMIVVISILGLSGCASSGTTEPTPAPSLSFEDLQSEYAQQLGIKGCMAFISGQYSAASEYFRILATIVPEWEGYDIGVLKEGKNFKAERCY